MRKIVSNILVVSTQLIVGGLFLFMLFSDSNESSQVVVVKNNNLDKMADAVSELFEVHQVVNEVVDTSKEEELVYVEEEKTEEVIIEDVEVVEEDDDSQELVSISTDGYISNVALGFEVTTNNKIYDLSDEEFGVLAAVVSCEAKKTSRDDVLAVMSVILNRADSSRYPNDPVSVVAAPYQFECYKGKSITPSELVADVMRDALNGVRNNGYLSFRSWQTTSYSSNYIVDGGNRYR